MIETVSELLAILSCKEPSGLLAGLRTLRKQWAYEQVCKLDQISVEMSSFTALLRYARSESEMPHFFDVFNQLYQAPTSESSQVFMHVFSSAVEILKRASLKSVASKVSRALIKEHLKIFYRFLSANHNAIVAPTLDLLTSVASVDGSINEVLFGAFDFALKPLPRFAMMRKKNLGQGERHDIRTAFVIFVMSFIEHGNYVTKQGMAKMQHLVGPVFSGIAEDKFELVKHILTVIKENVLVNEKGSKALPISFLFSSSLSKIAKLYESEDQRIVQEADDFLRLIGTNPDIGLVFKVSTDSIAENVVVKNKILLDFLLTLNPLESLQKQALCLDILCACPDISSSYWAKSSFSFEPEASARFINLCSFTVKVLRSVPFMLTKSSDILQVMPKGPSAASFGRGLGHSNKLVAYYSALLLAACYEKMSRYIHEIEWHISMTNAGETKKSLIVARNKMISAMLSRVPALRILQQAYVQLLKLEPSGSVNAILESILIAAQLSSRIFSHHVEYGRNLLTISSSNPVPPLTDGALMAYWDYIVECCPFAFDSASIQFILEQAHALGWPDVFDRLAYKAAASSGFANKEELEFLSSKTIDLNLCSSILGFLAELKKKKFLSAHSPNPFINGIGLGAELETFLQTSKDIFIPISAGTLSTATSHPDFEVLNADASVPELCGDSISSIFDEVLSKVKPDVILRAASRAPLDALHPIPQDITREDTSRLLLVNFDVSAWLQLLLKMFNNEAERPKDLRVFLESGVMALPIHCLCSQDEALFKAGHCLLVKFYELLESAKFRERREVKLLMDCFRNSIDAETRLPSVIAVFFSEAIQVILRPAHFMYAPVMELLLENFKLDLRKIPLMMECICSASETMAREQVWMLRILLLGISLGNDYMQTYQFNHVVQSVETLLQLPFLDGETEKISRRILEKILTNRGIASDLVRQNGLRVWAQCLPSQRSHIAEEILSHLI